MYFVLMAYYLLVSVRCLLKAFTIFLFKEKEVVFGKKSNEFVHLKVYFL